MSRSWSSYEESAPVSKKVEEPVAVPAKPFNYNVLRNKLVFGGLVGLSTGLTFGCVDAIRQHHSQFGRVGIEALQPVTRTAGTCGLLFAGFFFTYQGIKTTMEQVRGTEDAINIGAAAVLSGAPFLRHPVMRANALYAAALIALEVFHEEINGPRR
ncbi:hypothetical protein THRCLA_05674 [Thraustotheca clavata]|uniref:Mitochondrial import inner membrane translocase subunit TIM22 n=1 Tax=Thraustotheca clavata TaxID=74557 RepID=A0A1V9ZV63_9STRA|nr:hypothetical protein THRCLA_05674 [Thraustotheca clavata]